jgi:hypothetical protein
MFDPDAHMPRVNRGMVYLGALPHRRDSAGSGAAGECAGGADLEAATGQWRAARYQFQTEPSGESLFAYNAATDDL